MMDENNNRPAFQRLPRDAKDGHVEAALVYHMRWWSKYRFDVRNLVRKLNRSGVVVVDASQRRKERRGGR